MIVRDHTLNEKLYSAVKEDGNFFPPVMGTDDETIMQLLLNQSAEVNGYHDEKATCFAPYMFWNGWWRSKADTTKKQVVQAVWEKNIPYPLDEILGFEYWTRTYRAGQFLDLHVDEDTFLYQDSKTFMGPHFGAIWYGEDNLDGGFVEIHKASFVNGQKLVLERENLDLVKSPIEERERIAYRGNRSIIFDAGHVLHGTTPARSGYRQVMVINLWHSSNPPTALKNNAFYYE